MIYEMNKNNVGFCYVLSFYVLILTLLGAGKLNEFYAQTDNSYLSVDVSRVMKCKKELGEKL